MIPDSSDENDDRPAADAEPEPAEPEPAESPTSADEANSNVPSAPQES